MVGSVGQRFGSAKNIGYRGLSVHPAESYS